MEEYNRIRADIDLDALRFNVLQMKNKISNDVKLLVVIKADGYGHGATTIAKNINDLADYYGVATIDEAVELRQSGIDKEILVIGYTPSSDFHKALDYNVILTVYDYEESKQLSDLALKSNKLARVHIKVDTGMSRLGYCTDDEGIQDALRLKTLKGLQIEGIFTHFAKADEIDKTSAYKQLESFKEFINALEKNGISFICKHIDNSAGVMEMEGSTFDMVRIGIVTYGLYPSEEVSKDIELKPVMSVIAHVARVKMIPANTGIGYGWTYFTKKDSIIATVTAGYADGYPRAQSNTGRVIINGEYAPIVGRVCMDQFMIDVTDIPNVNIGDEVILIGNSDDKCISVEEVASPANSFNYELVCNISRRVPRVYYVDGKRVSDVNYLI